MWFSNIVLFFSLILVSCSQKSSVLPASSIQPEKVFFTTYAYGNEGWNHLYSISTLTQKISDEFTGMSGFEPRLFQENDDNGIIKNVYYSQYQMNQPYDVGLLISNQGTLFENTKLPKNTYDILKSSDNKLVSIGYDAGQISVFSPTYEKRFLETSSVKGLLVAQNSSQSNFIAVLKGSGKYFAVSSGYSSIYHSDDKTPANIYELKFEEKNDIFSSFSDFLSVKTKTIIETGNENLNSCIMGISGQLRISESKLLVTCNAQYTKPATPQILNTFLIDVSLGKPVIQKIISKTVNSEYTFVLGGLSKDKKKVLVTETSGYNGKIFRAYWLDITKINGENIEPVYNVAYYVTYNSYTESYIYSCVNINNEGYCLQKNFLQTSSDMTNENNNYLLINIDIPMGNVVKFSQFIL